MKNTILFPADSNYKIFDRELKKEYNAVLSLDLFDVKMFNYNLWIDEKIIDIDDDIKSNKVIYRGFMMKPIEYENFYNDLSTHSINLITKPSEYSKMHIFHNIYDLIKDNTAKSLFFSLDERVNINEIRNHFGKFIIKDFVKSVKNDTFPKCFSSSISQDDLDRYITEFKKYRGKLLTDGICIKEFLNFKYYVDRINEFRVFYMDGNILSISRNSLQVNYSNEPPIELINKYRNLPSNYYTIDFVELEDGNFKIMEVGDGQVSGLSDNQDYEVYYRAMYNCLN